MSGETEQQISGWTVDTYRIHNEAMRIADERFQMERDRRYAEVATEREKALKIKETADLTALSLAREIQTYKDEKANELREQISHERGLYPTRTELLAALDKIAADIKPLAEYVSSQQGRSQGIDKSVQLVLAIIAIAVTVVIFFATRDPSAPAAAALFLRNLAPKEC